MTPQILEYDSSSHRDAVVAALLAIREDCGTYPPAYVEASVEGVAEWLERYPAKRRWVAVDADGSFLGHIQVDTLDQTDPDLKKFLDAGRYPVASTDVAEIARLFVRLERRGEGVGRALLEHAESWIAHEGLRGAICVMVTQPEAIGLYQRAGWEDLGSFIGVSGVENRVMISSEAPQGRDTITIHAGVTPGPYRVVTPGIEVSTTFGMDEVGKYGEFAYARSANPTRTALERALAAAEGVDHGMAFSSGLAAIDAVLRLVKPSERVLVGTSAYGGTWRLLTKVWEQYGIGVDVVDPSDLPAVTKALETGAEGRVAMMLVETPANPTLAISDISLLASACREAGVLLVVDSTFASPALQRPVLLGADIVLHSTTKYVGGHSDVVGGFVGVNRQDLADHLRFQQRAVGAVPGPFDSFLVLRGLRTLPIRMRHVSKSAQAIAEALDGHPEIREVVYPGLPAHPQHELAKTQMDGFGGMLALIVEGGEERAVAMCETTRVFTLAESLGAVESLIEHPGRMTHLANAGSLLTVDPALVRLSVGLEDAGDLIRDLRQALAATR